MQLHYNLQIRCQVQWQVLFPFFIPLSIHALCLLWINLISVYNKLNFFAMCLFCARGRQCLSLSQSNFVFHSRLSGRPFAPNDQAFPLIYIIWQCFFLPVCPSSNCSWQMLSALVPYLQTYLALLARETSTRAATVVHPPYQSPLLFAHSSVHKTTRFSKI